MISLTIARAAAAATVLAAAVKSFELVQFR